jgi:uncharacterized protein
VAWRKTLRSFHRDIGYLVAGLTVAYAISGIAVDHVEEWNPNRSLSWTELALGPVTGADSDAIVATVVSRLDLDESEVRSHLMQGPTSLRIFMVTGDEIKLDPTTGAGSLKVVADRPVLREVNALHLNDLKGVWTWIADAFALALIFLAISGAIMLKGNLGISGRGKWLVGIGVLIPVVALIVGNY